jgi:hypothetical protein
MFDEKDHTDVESGDKVVTGPGIAEKTGIYVDETGAVPGDSFSYGNSTYAKLQRFAGKYAIEQRGIERVPENERTDTNLRKVGTMVRILFPPSYS